MATHRATISCFHGARLYQPGDEATFNPGDDVPEHFESLNQGAAEQPAPGPKAFHKGFGKYDAVRADGTVINDKPVTKEEAQALLVAEQPVT